MAHEIKPLTEHGIISLKHDCIMVWKMWARDSRAKEKNMKSPFWIKIGIL